MGREIESRHGIHRGVVLKISLAIYEENGAMSCEIKSLQGIGW
jgi:hypothetical protein